MLEEAVCYVCSYMSGRNRILWRRHVNPEEGEHRKNRLRRWGRAAQHCAWHTGPPLQLNRFVRVKGRKAYRPNALDLHEPYSIACQHPCGCAR